ncbi:TPA: helix-turn-helix domain-containing protein [Streptococcus suis]|nr:helix-turn-helix domain-containing protein [Streptococcus suis]HEM5037225.1 helix-turn-helix domain-containing protein [Streptococcus suis]HEM5112566.1 helix-turn-helix domain-containing protein [Streptococcus suis]HEM5187113.1 helix-turn-helix domain-containing protein [Streptococcus suis]HEM5670885.1 helix-turn-helix domain-containing protein [Streptococcus suis]
MNAMFEAVESLKREIVREVLQEVRKELADVKPPVQTSDESIGVKEACQIMGMSRNTFMVLVNTGKIPYHMVGTHYRFDKRDVKYYKSKMKIEKKVKRVAL